jgi:hypothetical protein
MNLHEYIRYNEVPARLLALIEANMDELDAVKARLARADCLIADFEFKIGYNDGIHKDEKSAYFEALRKYRCFK